MLKKQSLKDLLEMADMKDDNVVVSEQVENVEFEDGDDVEVNKDIIKHDRFLRHAVLQGINDNKFCDVTLLCKDGRASLNRLCLSIIFPSLHVDNLGDIVLSLPDYSAGEVLGEIEESLLAGLAGCHEDERIGQKFDDKEEQHENEELDVNDASYALEQDLVQEDSDNAPGVNHKQYDTFVQDEQDGDEAQTRAESLVGGEVNEDHEEVIETILTDVDSTIDDQMYKCELCTAGYKRRDDLQVHMLNSHQLVLEQSAIMPKSLIFCQFCAKAFRAKSLLKIHMRKHTGDKPFKCDQCEVSFTNLHNLRKHMKKHTGENKFLCEVCDKSLSSKAALIDHRTIHTGQRPHVCEDCGQSYKRSGNIYRHRQRCSALFVKRELAAAQLSAEAAAERTARTAAVMTARAAHTSSCCDDS